MNVIPRLGVGVGAPHLIPPPQACSSDQAPACSSSGGGGRRGLFSAGSPKHSQGQPVSNSLHDGYKGTSSDLFTHALTPENGHVIYVCLDSYRPSRVFFPPPVLSVSLVCYLLVFRTSGLTGQR